MQEVLILVRNFPPYNDKGSAGVGYVIRAIKFCKFLPDFGFKPVVVTVDKNPVVKVDPDSEPLLKEIAGTTEILYVPESRLTRLVEGLSARKTKLKREKRKSMGYWIAYLLVVVASGFAKNIYHIVKKRFLVPDEGILWNRKAASVCSELIQKRSIRCVLTISPPNSTHLLGRDLKKKFGLIWCADFKDAWVGNPLFQSKSRTRNRREEEQERQVLERADIVTSVNDPSVELLRSHTREREGQRFATIYNGFDPDELVVEPHGYDPGFINLIHCGVLYRERTLGPFLRVLTERAEKGQPFRVYLLGKVEDPFSLEYQKRYPKLVHLVGVAPRDKTISMIKGADVTLVVQSDFYFAPLSGKIFEYLACEKRVIGLVPKGIARDFIRNYRMGWSCDLDDEARIREILEEVYRLWKGGALWTSYPEEVKNRFDRKCSTGELAGLFREQMGSGINEEGYGAG